MSAQSVRFVIEAASSALDSMLEEKTSPTTGQTVRLVPRQRRLGDSSSRRENLASRQNSEDVQSMPPLHCDRKN